jgi:hypothetical protein
MDTIMLRPIQKDKREYAGLLFQACQQLVRLEDFLKKLQTATGSLDLEFVIDLIGYKEAFKKKPITDFLNYIAHTLSALTSALKKIKALSLSQDEMELLNEINAIIHSFQDMAAGLIRHHPET